MTHPGSTAFSAELRRVQLRSRRLITGDLLGNYRSAFRGSGLVFSDLRAYQPGDDIKHIHWKATARTGTVFVKSYEEDRQLRVLLVIDTSASMRAAVGVQAYTKAIEFCSLIGSLTQRGNDLLGLLLFGEKPGEFLPPKAGPKRLARILAAVMRADPTGESRTDMTKALEYVATSVRKPSIVFVISDFECPPFSDALKKALVRHDVILTHIQPPLTTLPALGLVTFRDAETGEVCVVDTRSRSVQRSWAQALERRKNVVKTLAKQCGADHIVITESCAQPLIHLMKERVQRLSR